MSKTPQVFLKSLFALLLIAVLINTSPALAQQKAAAAQPAAQASAQMAERLGKDDGYSLVIQYSGDLNGSLETCG